MKNKFLFLAAGLMIMVTACGSDRNTEDINDSLMTDSPVMDTASMGTGRLSTDSTALNP